MSGVVNPWSRHYQEGWMEHAGNRRLPLWLRVAALAYGRHTANGHARFKPSEIRLCLSVIDESTGEVWEPLPQHIHRAIQVAVEYKWLAPESKMRCLVVPAHAIEGGLGDPAEQCPQHRSRREASKPKRRLHVVTEAGA